MGKIIKNGIEYASGSNVTVAKNIIYDNTSSGMESTNVQNAITELNNALGGKIIETKVVPVPYLDGATYHTVITLNKTFDTSDMAIFFTPIGNYNMTQFTIAVEAISGNQVAIYGRANYGVTFPSGTVLYGSLMVVGKTV